MVDSLGQAEVFLITKSFFELLNAIGQVIAGIIIFCFCIRILCYSTKTIIIYLLLTFNGKDGVMNRKGFTLIELMVVMVIIGILVAVVPNFQAMSDKAGVTRQVIEDKSEQLEKDLDAMREKGETIFE